MSTKLKLDYPEAISEFERLLRKFNMKKKIYKLLFNGRGLEFEQFRNYDESDDAVSIDWNSSLKANKLLVRQYIEEKDINFYFVVEVSNSMLFGSGDKLKAEYAAEIILSLSDLVMSTQDKAGLVMFNDKIVNYIAPKNYKQQFYSMEQMLSDISSYGGGTNYKGVLEFLLQTIKNPNSVVVFISDFLHMPKSIESDFLLLSKKCEVVAISVKDILDMELPRTGDLLVLGDMFGNESLVVDTNLANRAYQDVVQKQAQEIRTSFKDNEIDYLELRLDSSFVVPIILFLQQREGGSGHGHFV